MEDVPDGHRSSSGEESTSIRRSVLSSPLVAYPKIWGSGTRDASPMKIL